MWDCITRRFSVPVIGIGYPLFRCSPVIFATIGVLLLFSVDLRAEKADPELLIADNNWRPWYFGSDKLDRPGFAVEIISHCVGAANYRSKFKKFPIERMRSMMKNGKMDISIFSFKHSRTAFLIYSQEALFRDTYVPFVRKDSAIEIDRISDFDGLRLGHLNGLRYSREYFDYIQQRQAAKTLDVTVDSKANIKKLVNGRIDIFVNTLASTNYHAHEMGLREKIRNLDYSVRSGEYFITLSKKAKTITDKNAFLATFDECVRQLKAGPRYGEIAARYGLNLADILRKPHFDR